MRLECFMASNSPDRNLAPHMSLPPAKPEQGRYGMSVENTAKTQVMSSQPSSRPLGEESKPELPPAAGPHSPGAVKPERKAPEAGGYEKDSTDSSTSNAKGGYGAG